MIRFLRYGMFLFMLVFSILLVASLAYSIRQLINDQAGGVLYYPIVLEVLGWSALGVITIVMLALTPIGDSVAAQCLPVRRQSLRESQRIDAALERVKQEYQKQYNRTRKIKVHVMDLPNINGMAFGRNSVAVSKGLLNVAMDDELAAILAHEIGHLHHGDGLLNLAMLVVSWPTVFLNRLVTNIFFSSDDDKSSKKSDDGTGLMFFLCFGVLAIAIFFMYFAILWALSFPVLWLMRSLDSAIEWPIEYKADRFAVSLGLGQALVSILEQVEGEDIRAKFGFLQKYVYSHPPTALRIDKIERNLLTTEPHQNL